MINLLYMSYVRGGIQAQTGIHKVTTFLSLFINSNLFRYTALHLVGYHFSKN